MKNKYVFALPICLGLGTAIGAFIHNIGLGLAMGAAAGTTLGLFLWYYFDKRADGSSNPGV